MRQLSSGNWQARYTGPDGLRYTAPNTFASKALALDYVETQQAKIRLNLWEPPAPAEQPTGDLSVAQWCQQWLASHRPRLRDSSHTTYQTVMKTRIAGYPPFHKLRISKLSKDHVRTWWQAMVALTPETGNRNNKAYKLLRTAVDAAVDAGILETNPVVIKASHRRTAPLKHKQLPTDQELLAILNNTPARYRLAVALCLFHGLRVGECLALQRRHVMRVANGWVVRVEATLVRVPDHTGRMVMKRQPPKTQAGYRDVPILKEHRSLVVKHLAEYVEPRPGALVTTTATGGTVMDTSFRSVFHRAKNKAGVSSEITPHYGHNWLITRLAEQQATPTEIGRILGQSDLSTILHTYMRVREHRPGELMAAVSIESTDHHRAG